MLERLAKDKHSSLLGLFVIYKENRIVNTPQWPYSQYFIFFITYESAHSAIVLGNTRLEMLARDKHSSLSGPFVIYKENKALLLLPQTPKLIESCLIYFETIDGRLNKMKEVL